MKKVFLHVLFIFLIVVVCIASAQTASVEDLNEQMRVWSSFENDLLNEQFRLNEGLNDPDIVVFYNSESDSWITMPRAQAIELADRLIVVAEMNPSIINRLKQRLGLGWFLIEQALQEPGLAASTLISMIEAKQKPQLEAVLADYDSLLAQVREQFFSVQAQRDTLLNAESFDCGADLWIGVWQDPSYGNMILTSDGESLSGTYGGDEKTIKGQVIENNGRCFFMGEWGRSNSERRGPFLFELVSPSQFSGIWGENRGAFTFQEIDEISHNWDGIR